LRGIVSDKNEKHLYTDGLEIIAGTAGAIGFRHLGYLTLSNQIFLPPAHSPALIYFGRERGCWITCNCPTVLKRKT
jgi:hypothetical protein